MADTEKNWNGYPCPTCGSPARCYTTRQVNDENGSGVRRYRRCTGAHCGLSFSTIELTLINPAGAGK